MLEYEVEQRVQLKEDAAYKSAVGVSLQVFLESKLIVESKHVSLLVESAN